MQCSLSALSACGIMNARARPAMPTGGFVYALLVVVCGRELAMRRQRKSCQPSACEAVCSTAAALPQQYALRQNLRTGVQYSADWRQKRVHWWLINVIKGAKQWRAAVAAELALGPGHKGAQGHSEWGAQQQQPGRICNVDAWGPGKWQRAWSLCRAPLLVRRKRGPGSWLR
jgi:hypothetical protein